MARIRRFDHVGITVADLDTMTAFFVGLGLEVEGREFVEGEFIDTVIGIPNSRTEIVMVRPPDGGTGLELSALRPSRARTRIARRRGERARAAQRRLRSGRTPADRRPAPCGRLRPGRRHR